MYATYPNLTELTAYIRPVSLIYAVFFADFKNVYIYTNCRDYYPTLRYYPAYVRIIL